MKLFEAYYFLIFLSLTTTSIAFRYAKPECSDMCGNVRIPYPFGIGSTCSINEWYNVDCISSTPYLPAFHHLEVRNVNIENQTVTVNMPMISDCRNQSQSKSVDLGGSPFLFSKSHNNFVYKGCGSAVMTDDGSVLTRCSTTCRNDTASDKNNCLGISCCQTTIPHYLKSYNINLYSLERKVGGDEDCGSAFLVDKNSYINGSFSSQNTFVPVSLLWTLSDMDFNQVTCCESERKLKVDLGNGNSVDTWKCSSAYSSSLNKGSSYLVDGCSIETSKEVEHYAKLGCNDTCGNIRIPYPFGIGAHCSINEWYIVDCNSSTPYLSKLKHLEVVGVDLKNHTVTINMPTMSDCQDPVPNSTQAMGVDLGGSPFLFSKENNKFVVEGCGNAVIMHNGIGITGCSTTCQNESASDKNSCYGISCCQTTFPQYLTSYSINLMSLERLGGGCVSAFVVDENSFNNRSFSSQSSIVPISLTWTLSDSGGTSVSYKVDLGNGTLVHTWYCDLPSSHKGNPYLVDGCE